MPFNDEYRQELYTSKMADISNTNLNMVASGCVSAEFMKTFIGPTDYIHCDIVGSVEYTNTPIPTLLKTLVYFAKEYK
jgi:leucyl aminopeptidase